MNHAKKSLLKGPEATTGIDNLLTQPVSEERCIKTLDGGILLILDGISEIVVHVKSNLCYLICLRHLNRSKIVKNRIFF